MYGRLFTVVGVIFSLLFVSGCANFNEGVTDYALESERFNPGGSPMALKAKYAQNGNEQAKIIKGDTITIDLKQGFIKNFTERSGIFDFNGTKGEIAIVANVYEMSNVGGRNKINFGPDSINSGRVVFFSSDVRKGQPLNLSQIPMYGPMRYDGNRLVIQLYVIEIDAQNSQMTSLLSTLASLGGTAYPPASPVLKVLDTLGSSLIKANKNDIEFAYTMTLLPDSGSGYAEPAVLTAGNYIFGRREDRTQNFDWAGLRYNDNTGRLQNGDGSQYRDETYLTVQIDKGYDEISLELQQATLTELVGELNAEKASDLNEVKAIAEGYAKSIMRLKKRNKARALLDKIRRGGLVANVAQSTSFELMDIVTEGIATKKNAAVADTLDESDLDYLLSGIRAITPAGFDDNQATTTGLYDDSAHGIITATRDAVIIALEGEAQK